MVNLGPMYFVTCTSVKLSFHSSPIYYDTAALMSFMSLEHTRHTTPFQIFPLAIFYTWSVPNPNIGITCSQDLFRLFLKCHLTTKDLCKIITALLLFYVLFFFITNITQHKRVYLFTLFFPSLPSEEDGF